MMTVGEVAREIIRLQDANGGQMIESYTVTRDHYAALVDEMKVLRKKANLPLLFDTKGLLILGTPVVVAEE